MAKVISNLSTVLSANCAPFVKAFGTTMAPIKSFTSSLTSAGATILKFTGIGAAVAGVMAVFGTAKSSISLAAELEQNSVAFQTMLGSADAAKKMMSDLQGFAASTPFEFPALAKSSKTLLAFGVAGDQILPTLKAIGDVSAATGKDIGELSSIYGKAKASGVLMANDINQLVDAGVPVFREFAKQLGVGEDQIKKLASEGKLSFGMLQQAFVDLTGKGGQFENMMAAQSQTLGGLWSSLTDNVSMTLAGLVTTIVNAFNLKPALSALVNGIGTAGGYITAAVSAWAPIIVGWATTAWQTVANAFRSMLPAVRQLGVVVMQSAAPFLKLGQVVGGVVVSAIIAMLSAVRSQSAGIGTASTVVKALVLAIGGAIVGYLAWRTSTAAMTAVQFALTAAGSAWGIVLGIVNVGTAKLVATQKAVAAVIAVTKAATMAVIGSTYVAAAATAAWSVATSAATFAHSAAVGVINAVRLAIAAGGLAQIGATAATLAGSAAQWLMTTAMTAGRAVIAAIAGVTGIGSLATAAWAVVTGTATAAQWLLNAALTANPVGLVVVAVAALGAGLAYAITRITGMADILGTAKKAFDFAGFAIANWQATLKYAAAAGAYEVVKLGSQLVNMFTNVIPAVLVWFGQNWRDIVTFTGTVFGNLLTNAANFGAALWEAIKGNGFSFEWTPLTEGFKSAVKELTKIAEREIGPLEQSLGEQAGKLGDALNKGFTDYQAAASPADALVEGVQSAVAGMPTVTPPEIATPQIDPLKIDASAKGLEAMKGGLDGVAKSAAAAAEALKLTTAGSAEAMAARASTAADAMLADARKPHDSLPVTDAATSVVVASKSPDVRQADNKADAGNAMQQITLLIQAIKAEAVKIAKNTDSPLAELAI